MTSRKKPSPSDHDDLIDRLGGAVDSLANEVREHRDQVCDRLKGVQDAVDELRTQVQWLCNNRPDDLRVRNMAADPLDEQWSQKLNRKVCVLACTECDCDSPASLDEALKAGWSELMHDDQQDWDYLGLCPDCRRREDDQVVVAPQSVREQQSEAVETEYCCTKPRLAWNGDPNMPGVACLNCGYVVAEMGSLADAEGPKCAAVAEAPDQPEKVTGSAATNFLWEDE